MNTWLTKEACRPPSPVHHLMVVKGISAMHRVERETCNNRKGTILIVEEERGEFLQVGSGEKFSCGVELN